MTDEEEISEDEETPKRKSRKNGAATAHPRVARTEAPQGDPELLQAAAHAQRHQERLDAETWTPNGEGAVRGLDGYQEELEVAARFGYLSGAGLIIKQTEPAGPNKRPIELGTVQVDMVPDAGRFYEHCMAHYAKVGIDVTIKWQMNRGVGASGRGGNFLCAGYLDLPARQVVAPPAPPPAPPPPSPQTRGDAGSPSAVQPPPHWQPTAPAPPPFSGAPPGYPGYPYPGYPPYAYPPPPAPAPQAAPAPAAASPMPPPPPPGTPPETQAYIKSLTDQIAQDREERREMQEKLNSLAASRTPLTADEIDRLIARGVEDRLRAQQHHAPPATPAAPPVKEEDFLDRAVGFVEKVESVKTRLGYKPVAEPAPSAAPVVTHVEAADDDSPVTMLDGGEGSLAIPIDKKTGKTQLGTLFLQNLPMLGNAANGLLDKLMSGQEAADERQARLAKERDEARKRDAMELEAIRHANRMKELALEQGARPAVSVTEEPARKPSGPRPWEKK